MMDYPKSKVPTGVTEWGNPNGPFPELAAFALAVCKTQPSIMEFG